MLSDHRYHFPVSARLKKRADFQRVYREGVRVFGRFVVVFLMPAVGKQGRLGVTASRKVGGAVVRSRCKRRLREVYRIHRWEIEDRAVDIVVNAHKSVSRAPWEELEEDFVDSIRRGLRVLERTRPGPSRRE